MSVELVITHEGAAVPFDRTRIENGIYAAAQSAGLRKSRQWAETLSWAVVGILEERFGQNGGTPTAGQVQAVVEDVLARSGHPEVAAAYARHQKQQAAARASSPILLDVERLVNDYLHRADWRVNENSNMNYSLQGLNNYVSSAIAAHYWLHEIYPPEVQRAHVSGGLHLHDLGMLSVYCCGWDLMDLLMSGFGGVPTKIESRPPKHLRSALGQLVNFFYTLQGESAGAVAVSNFDTLLAPFVRYDRLDYGQIKQAMQEFVFNINTPTRVGFQTPFTNTTMDLTPSPSLQDLPVIIGGEPQQETYGEFQQEMDLLNRAFAEVMLEGDAKGRVFTFPIPTYNITRDFDWENPNLEPVWRMTARYGIPYWANFVNSDMKPEDARSMCPLHPDTPVVVRAGRGMFVRTIKDVYYTHKTKGTQYEVLFNGQWYPAKVVATPSQGCREFTLGNGAKVVMDVRHEQPVKRGRGQPIELLTAGEIREGMYLPFNGTPISDTQDNYEAGFAVGAFLGDGSYDKGALNYALNDGEKEERVAHRLRAFFTQFGLSVSQNPQKGRVSLLRVGGSGDAAERWMAQFVAGRQAKEKGLTPRAFQMGQEFIRGLLDGWYATDGGNRGRIYTASPRLCRDFTVLCGLVGRPYKIDRQGDTRDGRYGDGPVFTLKFHNRTSYGSHFFHEDGFWWYPVETIRPVEYQGQVYCFAVDSEKHLFQTADGLVTHNCRLRLDNRQLQRRLGGLFAAAPLTGSVGVVTINLPRLGYLAQDEADFLARLEELMEIACTSLEIKREVLEQHTEQGLYPYARHYLRGVKSRSGKYWSNHFSTIGLIGMNEACLNLLGVGIDTPKGKDFAIRTLDFMREVLTRFQHETGNLYNLEATPAEGASFRLARADRQRFPDIITAGTDEAPYYTNSTHLPVSYSDDLFAVLEHQDDLQTLYTGGTVLHIFLGEQLEDWRQARRLVRVVAENFHLPYYTLTPTFSVCPVHGYIPGEHRYCPYDHTPEQLARFGIRRQEARGKRQEAGGRRQEARGKRQEARSEE